jgi:hypothetical protein
MNRVPLLRPEFGPSLPELVGRRFSVSRRAVAIGAIVALVVLAVVIKVVIDDGRKQLTVHGKPSFNVLYDPGQLHRVTPHPGELMRLEGHRAHLDVDIDARDANLPPYSGDVIGGLLPLYTTQYTDRLKVRLPGFVMGDEGKARLNQAPGYQIAYTSGPAGNRTFWREVFVLPKADEPDQTIVLRMRQTFSGRAGPRDRALLMATKKAFRSFRFGAHRPLFQGG